MTTRKALEAAIDAMNRVLEVDGLATIHAGAWLGAAKKALQKLERGRVKMPEFEIHGVEDLVRDAARGAVIPYQR